MFGSIGYPELIVLGIVAVLLFGSRLPQVARSLGQSYRELMRGLNELKSNFDIDDEPDEYRPVGLPDYTAPETEESAPEEDRFDLEPDAAAAVSEDGGVVEVDASDEVKN